MVTTEKTALERLDKLATDIYMGRDSSAESLQNLVIAVKEEASQERKKTHKQILTEAFERCGIEFKEKVLYPGIDLFYAENFRFRFLENGSYEKP